MSAARASACVLAPVSGDAVAASLHPSVDFHKSPVVDSSEFKSFLGTAHEGVPQTKRWQSRVLPNSFSSPIDLTFALVETGAHLWVTGPMHAKREHTARSALVRHGLNDTFQPRGDAEHFDFVTWTWSEDCADSLGWQKVTGTGKSGVCAEGDSRCHAS